MSDGARPRFYEGFPWRFLIINLSDFRVLMSFDAFGRDFSGVALLNKPWQFSGKAPSDDPRVNLTHGDDPYLAEGVRGLIGLRREGGVPKWKPQHSGLILQVQDDGDEAGAVSSFTSFDPWQYLYARPVRKADLTLPGKNGLSFKAVNGNEIALDLLQRTIDEDGPCYIDVDSGTFETTDELTINFQAATSVGAAWDQLCGTGSMDIRLKPIWDPVDRPGKLVELSIVASLGEAKPDAIFAYGVAPFSLARITRLEDGTQRANTVQEYAGDAARPVTPATDATSGTKYGTWFAQEILTGQNVDAAAVVIGAERLRLSKDGQTLVTISPFPERSPIPQLDYDIGDRVHVIAGKNLRKPLDAYQRIYGIPYQIGDDMVERVDHLITSADGT